MMPGLTTIDALLERMVTATEKLLTNIPLKFDKYLPLSGGIMTAGPAMKRNVNNSNIVITGGTRYDNSASLIVNGGDASANAGTFQLLAQGNSSARTFLVGNPDGTLAWGGQPIQTSSDKRLKQDFSSVPADVLKAWGKVEWQQFKYKADVERKGDSCRFHTGLVAQDVHEVCGDEILKYGILCHEVQEAVEEEKDEDGNVIREASEAVDMWTVRYEEALAMEVIYLRNEIKKMQAEIRKLKKA